MSPNVPDPRKLQCVWKYCWCYFNLAEFIAVPGPGSRLTSGSSLNLWDPWTNPRRWPSACILRVYRLEVQRFPLNFQPLHQRTTGWNNHTAREMDFHSASNAVAQHTKVSSSVMLISPKCSFPIFFLEVPELLRFSFEESSLGARSQAGPVPAQVAVLLLRSAGGSAVVVRFCKAKTPLSLHYTSHSISPYCSWNSHP